MMNLRERSSSNMTMVIILNSKFIMLLGLEVTNEVSIVSIVSGSVLVL
jgi:hypothetical protein